MSTDQPILPTDAIRQLEHKELERLRSLSLKERGELIAAACRTAADIEASRLKMGMLPVQPAPWPESTWRFLAEHAPGAKQR